MLIVGLTGNIGSGKSSVARLLAARGIPVIDADELARDAVARGTPALAAITARWGSRVTAADGALDRAALRAIVFANRADREALDSIVHPAVQSRREELVEAARARGERVVVCDIPLLFEANLLHEVDVILLVDAPRATRLKRIVESRQLSTREAELMIDAQLPSEPKRAQSNFVIDNDGSLETLKERTDAAWTFIESQITS